MKKKILVVDDSTLVRYKVKEGLEQFDVDVIELDNAKDIFVFSKKFQKMDLIILDINLPDMDGITALEKIRTDKEWLGVPVIMLTGKSDRKTVERALVAGAVNYVKKPFTSQELVERVEQVLGPLPLSQENSEVFSDDDLLSIIDNELDRAKLGNYNISLVRIDISNNTERFKCLDDLINLRDEMKALLRRFDSLVISKDYSLLVILPLMDEKGVVGISDKISFWLEEKYDERIKPYSFVFSNDGDNSNDIMKRLYKTT